jgi:hypothetical protein
LAIRGYIDAVASPGYVEGWAYDEANELRPLRVEVWHGETMLTEGLANLFRHDLIVSGYGAGWCAFCLKLAPGSQIQTAALTLFEAGSGHIIAPPHIPRHYEREDPPARDLYALTVSDPTSLTSLTQLAACGPVFAGYIAQHGYAAFVRAAWAYVLAQRAMPDIIASTAEELRAGRLTPLGLLETLAQRPEFAAQPRPLAAPRTAAFPFGGAVP